LVKERKINKKRKVDRKGKIRKFKLKICKTSRDNERKSFSINPIS